MALNRNLPPVPISTFSMVPKSDVPRSNFKTTSGYKTTFDAGYLVPVYVEEVLPGDSFKGDVTFFARMATPIYPVMDNLYFESFFFFVPNRIVWTNWVKMMGEQDNPGDSISFTVPQVTGAVGGGFTSYSPADYFGLPVASILITGTMSANALPFRAYNLIFNEWFRDENLTAAAAEFTNDASQADTQYPLRKRSKRPDYFTSALPWPLKGGVSVSMPLAGQAVVKSNLTNLFTGPQPGLNLLRADTGAAAGNFQVTTGTVSALSFNATAGGAVTAQLYPANLYADMSTATGATINALRLAVTTQQFLEKDARGGTRYAELLRMHFGVTPQDARLDRPEYIGGGQHMFNTQAIPQTATPTAPATTPIGTLGGATVGNGRHRFDYSASEHGFIIGIINVRADITYQQGMHRMFSRLTRYDYYWPTFAFLGEQIIRQDEIYATGTNLPADVAAFGYQERWAEYRYRPSRITGKFRSYPTAGTLDAWHLAQAFSTPPALNNTFIQDASDAVVQRAVAAGATAVNQQFLLDSVWHISATRPLPARSVPGLTRF